MKTLISKLVVIVAFVCATNVNAQNSNQFDIQLETTLRDINSDDAASVSKGMDELKRIASQYPDAWLPTYYQALSALQYAVRFPNDNHSSSFLEAAKTGIEALRTKPIIQHSSCRIRPRTGRNITWMPSPVTSRQSAPIPPTPDHACFFTSSLRT